MGPSKIELAWALKQLQALGYIEFSRENETRISLTETGFAKGREILDILPICDRILTLLTALEIETN